MHALIALVALLVLVQLQLVRTAPVVTQCQTQLHTFYEGLGMSPLFPVSDPIIFTTGMVGPVPFVTATVAFQDVARLYQAAITGPPPLPNVVAFSFDLPWCVEQLDIACESRATHGLGKTDACQIVDFDLGGASQIAGRIWVYVNQSATCGGYVNLTFFNTTLSPPATFDGVWTYGTQGLLPPYPALSLTEAQTFYQNSSCDYSDGAVADAQAQGQFVCVAQRIGCAGTRTNGQASPYVLPVPNFACRGNVTQNSTNVTMVWKVCSYDLPGAVTGYFYLRFCAPNSPLCLSQFQQQLALNPGSLTAYSLIASTCRQFISPYDSWDQQLLISYQGQITTFLPTYILAPNDVVVREVPCLCGFSVACNGAGDVYNDTTTVSQFLLLDNALPIPYPGPAFEFPKGQPQITLLGNGSYDPDSLPGLLSVYWKIYSQPSGSPPVDIPWPVRSVQDLNATLFFTGLYQFVLYASDSQTVSFALLNVTVINNIITCIINMPESVVFEPYYGSSPGTPTTCANPPFTFPSPTITLNGSLTTSTNPSVTLYRLWEQTVGYPTPLLQICVVNFLLHTALLYDQNQIDAQIVVPNIGLYGYNLTVTDNETSCETDVLFYVVPDFLQPLGPTAQLPNYTAAPLRNITLEVGPVAQYPNVTYNLTPTANLTLVPTSPAPVVPPVFPNYGPPTADEILVLLAAWAVGMFALIMLLAYYIIVMPFDQWSQLDHIEYTVDSF